MTAKTYAITPAKATKAVTELHDATGISIDPNAATGATVVHGVHLSWTNYAGQLAIKIISKPWYVTEEQVWEPLDKAFA